VVGPLEASASSQVSFINAETQAGTNVIVIAANDPDAVCTALGEARSAGAKIVAFDSDANPDCRDVFISQVVAKEVALIQTKLIADQIGGSGEIAILSATANATNQNEWIKFMEEDLASNPAYKDIKLVAKVYGDDDDTKSFQEAQGLLQAHPNLKGIISPTTVGIAATARYLSTSAYKGKVALTGLGLPNEMRPFVKDGTVKEFALWDPAQLGYVAAFAGKALVEGKITGAPGDTFTAGKLGDRTIEEGGLVIVGPPTVFNAQNIDQYNF
jgi:rhamnose transport system substrate-binding protein